MSPRRHPQAAMTPRTRTGWRRLLSPIAILVSAFLFISAGAAFAYVTLATNSGTAQGQAITLHAPGAGSATSPTTTSLSISWGASGSPGGYQVLRSTTNVGPYSAVSSGTCGQSITEISASTSCVDTGLTPGITYYYEVLTAYFNGSVLWTSAPTAQFSGTTAKATPTITTATSTATPTVGGSLTDQATVSGGSSPTGTITWKVYASTDTTCTTPLFTYSSGQSVTGDTTYTSGSLTPTAVGSYIWGFAYTGDTSNDPISACGGTNEAFTVNQATPTLGTSATVSVSVGGTVSDTATLSNSYNATGTITYTLYGPSASQACTAPVGQVTSTVVSGTTVYTSPTITPPSAGTYWWIANYGGDANNTATTNSCGATGESSVVNKVTPTITTQTSVTTVTVGGSLSDTATVSGGFNPTGTITWKVYASSDTSCTTALFGYAGTKSVNGNTTYSPTSSVTVTTPGTYIWGFSYAPGADINNNAVSGCGGTNESFTVTKATPTLTTTPSPSSLAAGSNAADQAMLSGGYGTLTGTISYKLYAPSDSTCSGTPTPLSPTGSTVTAAGTYTSGSVAPSLVGTWHWIATFTDSDGNNNGVSGTCSGTGSEPLTVTMASPTVTSVAPSSGATGTAISASSIASAFAASSGSNASGTLTFYESGPLATAPATCTGVAWTQVGTASMSGNGTYTSSGGFTPSTAGNYWWYVAYSGDTNNNTAKSTCPSTTETAVTAAQNLAFTTSAVAGSTSTTPNLGQITVQRLNGGTPITGGTLTVNLSSSGAGTGVFGATQFGSTETTVTIASGSSTASFWYGNSATGSPTITASASSFTSATQQEATTTAPAGLTLTSITDSGGSISCGAPSSDVTSCSGSVASGGSFTAKVEFVASNGTTGVVYSTTQSSTITITVSHGSGGGSVTVASGATTSTGTFSATASGSSGLTASVTFGPYTINISLTS